MSKLPAEMSDDGNVFSTSYMCFDEVNYETMLQLKVDRFLCKIEANENLTSVLSGIELETIYSRKKHFRQRCRFAIQGSSSPQGLVKLHYAIWDRGGPTVRANVFAVASLQIFNLMPVLLTMIENSVILSQNLQAINFLSSTTGDIIATLIYDKCLHESWENEVINLRMCLLACSIDSITDISVIGRSKGMKIVVGKAYIYEELQLNDGRKLQYKQVEDGFSNPNADINAKVLDWLCGIVGSLGLNGDLLEMFCGNGNHAVALSKYFRKIMCVELNKSLCKAAEENLSFNNVTNVSVVTCDSARYALKLLKQKGLHFQKPLVNLSPQLANSMSSDKELLQVQLDKENESTAGIRTDAASTVGDDDHLCQNQSHYDASVISAHYTADDDAPSAVVHRTPSLPPPPTSSTATDMHDFSFTTVLVDPPRAGVDAHTLKLLALYEYIIYISCNPDSLIRDLHQLILTHDVIHMAAIDHFAYTPHLEVACVLKLRT